MDGIKQLLKRFSPYFKDYIPQFVLSFIGMILAAAGAASTAYIIKPVLDDVFINKDQDLLYLLPLAIIAIYFAKGLGKYMQVYYSAYIGQDIIKRIRNNILKNTLTFEMSFFHKYRSGELISRNINDIERVRLVVSTMIPEMLRETFTIIALLIYVIYLNPEMAFYSLVFIPLAIYPLSRLAKKMKYLSLKAQEKTSDLTSRLTEIFNNIEIIKANAAEKFERNKFEEENQKFFQLNVKATKTSELVSPLMETLGSVAVALVIILGGSQVIEGTMTVGEFFSFTTALFMLYTPIKRISSLYNKMQDAVAASERIFFMLDKEPSIMGGSKEAASSADEIEFKNVVLKYDDKTALSNVSFTAKKGEVTAFVGNSGGGKSSLANMILRFYDPNDGEVLLDNENIKEYDLKSLRNAISIVTQRVYIFNDTVAANIAYGQDIDEEKVIESLKKANAIDFVSEMENGIYTQINEFGTNLSGGQRQRIAIARAIYPNPKILIFDEATSALDTKSEQKITDAIQNIIKDKITFIIAHRLNTVQNADKIIVLKEGEIKCIGKHDELLNDCSEYNQLYGLQK